MKILGLISFAILLSFYSLFSWSYVAELNYNWYIIPLFPTLPKLNMYHFIGITFFIGTIIRYPQTFLEDEYENKTLKMSYIFLSPWLTLFTTWLFYNVILK